MNSAKLATSPRLQRVYNVLKRGPKTTRDIIMEADVCAVNSIISELRLNDKTIDCWPTSKKGVYVYILREDSV